MDTMLSTSSPTVLRSVYSPTGPATTDHAIVCLAGGACPSWIFDATAAAHPTATVIAVDYLEAMTRSPRLQTWADIVEEVRGIIMTLAVPTVVLGHSLGGAIALSVLGTQPENVSGALICSTGLSAGAHRDRDLPARLADGFSAQEQEQFVDSCVRSWSPEPRARFAAHLAGVEPGTFRHLMQEHRRQDLSDAAARIRVPVTIVHGIHDARRPLDDAIRMRAAIGGARLFLLDTGHSPMIEAPAEFGDLLANTVRRCVPHLTT